MSDPRAERAAQIQDSIRQILFREWDPIGVNEDPNLLDEYDSYIAGVYRILVGSHSEEELIEFLSATERDAMGLSEGLPEKLRPVARKLLTLDVAL